MNEAFEKLFKEVMAMEGGYADVSEDAGGETYKGIARNFHPTWTGWGIIDIEKEGGGNFAGRLDASVDLYLMVKDFYKINFWDRFRGDDISLKSLPVAAEMFDIAVNMGCRRAGEFLQKALNFLNRDGRLYLDLICDGKIGAITLDTLSKYLKNDSAKLLVKILNVMQGAHYLSYAERSSEQEIFIRGWFNHRVKI